MAPELLTYQQIDKKRWDAAIDKSSNGLIYAKSFYLDRFSPDWSAIVWNDYSAVMPLTWRKRYGIQYLCQPAFTQQGGLYSAGPLAGEVIGEFEKLLTEHFKFAEFALNYSNDQLLQESRLEEKNNFIIDLHRPYENIFEQYQHGFTKSLRRIKKFELQYTEADDHAAAIDLYQLLYGKRISHVKESEFMALNQLCSELSARGNIVLRQAFTSDDKLAALVLLLRDRNRLYNMISCMTEEGKQQEANYFLYDQLIKEFAGQELILDLEGSDLKGVARFYEKMGGINQPYPFVRYNNLPALVKIFKR
ncbi:MAG: hypothetical protein JWQ27_1769 [Ferruginibacter sp.]|nr:hypothetical protein [Ferruginibacter sp.]